MRSSMIGRLIVVISTMVIAVATLRAGAGNTGSPPACLFCGPFATVDAILNVLLFLPLGLGLAMARVRASRVVITVLALSAVIELLQIQMIHGRDAAIGDLLTNAIGGAIGYGIGRGSSMLLKPSRRFAEHLFAAWIIAWTVSLAAVSFSFVPMPAHGPYYAQIARPLSPPHAIFPGQVLSVWIDNVRLRPGLVPQNASLARMLERTGGPRVRILLSGPGFTAGRAELFELSDQDGHSAFSLEQLGRDLILGVRTGADVMRLRTYEFRLADAFATAPHDTLRVAASYGTRRVEMSVSSGRSSKRRTVVARLSHGWLLIAPNRIYVEGHGVELTIGAIWLALSLMPAGYWGTFAWIAHTRRRTVYVACVVAATGVSFALLPLFVDVHAAALWEWFAAAAGLAIGAALAHRVARPVAVSHPVASQERPSTNHAGGSTRSRGTRHSV